MVSADDGKKHSLVIRDVTEDDKGLYNVEAETPEGEVITAFHIIPTGHKVVQGDKEIEPSDKFVIKKKGRKLSLVVHDVDVEDAGEYTVKVKDTESKAVLSVEEKPVEFASLLEDTTVPEDTPEVTLECEVSKDKPEVSEVTWKKGKDTLSPDDEKYVIKKDGRRHSLTIKDITPEDADEYTCAVGDKETAAKVTVEETPLEFTSPLEDKQVPEETEEVTLECEVSKEKPKDTEVTWKKGKDTLSPDDEKYVIKKDGRRHSLTIKEVTPEDAGEYTCAVGDKETAAKVTVEETPLEFTSPLEDKQVPEETEEVTLECEVSKDKPKDTEVTWKKGKDTLSPDDEKYVIKKDGRRHSLTIKDVTPEDADEYTCTVGDKETAAKVTVEETPLEFTSPLEDKQVPEETEEVTLECEVSKDKPKDTEVTWKKGKDTLSPDDEKYVIKKDGRRHSLTIKEVTPEDADEYTCTVGDKETAAKVTVEEHAPEITKPLEETIAVPEGNEVTLEAQISKEDAPVTWMKDGKELKPSDNVRIEEDGTTRRLILKDVTKDDTAQYTLKLGDKETKSDVVVKTPPKIEIDEKFLNVTIRAGGKATISAIITGLPVPDVTWLKDDVPLETTKRVSISEDKQEKLIVKMILDKAERSDLGTYTLTAANDVGKDLVKMTITVLDKPQPPEELKIDKITPENVTISWSPPKDDGGSPVTEYIIEKRDMKRSTWSPRGHHLRNHLHDVPYAPGKPEVSEIDVTQATLTWSPPEFDGGSEITNYIIEKTEVGRKRWTKVNKKPVKEPTFKVTDLIEGNEYQFRIIAENAAGQSKPSEPSDVIKAKPPYVARNGLKQVQKSLKLPLLLPISLTEIDYQFRVSAENKAGVGKPSLPSDTITAKLPFDKPGKPGKPEVTEFGPKEITITWTPPESDGGSPIIGYIIEHKPGKPGKPEVTDFGPKEITITWTPPESDGGSPVIGYIIEHKPGKPGKPEVTDFGPKEITITWTPPESDGGSPIIGYIIEHKPGKPGKPEVTDFGPKEITITWTPPESDGGSPIIGYIIEHKPGKPGKPEVTDFGPKEITITWTPPESDGGSPIIGYIIEHKPGKPGKPEVTDFGPKEITITWTPPESDGGSPIIGYIINVKD
ncbi:putative titin [Apostichopus japonicus]|uniref:Putative titin n=1 Tax=Stichopus japonicus TaxID=307972 RepID=A0A2G8LL42_STIJA|nr:putative titin [Apostichopus japonicus]